MSNPEEEEPDIYADSTGPEAYASYTVYVDCGDAEKKFKAFAASLGDAIETSWNDREWK